jgi:hypothetical protein
MMDRTPSRDKPSTRILRRLEATAGLCLFPHRAPRLKQHPEVPGNGLINVESSNFSLPFFNHAHAESVNFRALVSYL